MASEEVVRRENLQEHLFDLPLNRLNYARRIFRPQIFYKSPLLGIGCFRDGAKISKHQGRS